MARTSSIVTRIRERIALRKAQLPDLVAAMETHRQALAELTVRHTALVMGIEEDTTMLESAAPKNPRVKKAKTLGQQIGTDAKEGELFQAPLPRCPSQQIGTDAKEGEA